VHLFCAAAELANSVHTISTNQLLFFTVVSSSAKLQKQKAGKPAEFLPLSTRPLGGAWAESGIDAREQQKATAHNHGFQWQSSNRGE
jgi:hypothetical protein